VHKPYTVHRLPLATAGLLTAALLALSAPANAQVVPCSTVENSTNLPPAGSPPLLRCYQLLFYPDGAQAIDNATYLYYIQPSVQPSLRSQNTWVPYREANVLDAFNRLMKTKFLDDLWIEVIDEPYENGVMGKHVVFHMEESPRLKDIEYTGSKEVAISKIVEALNDKNIVRPWGGFVPPIDQLIRQVRGVIKDLYGEQGYPDATVEVKMTSLPSGPKLVRLTFDIKAGPKVRLKEITFDGNAKMSDEELFALGVSLLGP
jgi:hypothetical protein